MKRQDQIDVIQATIDGRKVTYTTKHGVHSVIVPYNHLFDFARYIYTVEPLYQKDEIIMVEYNSKWWPMRFIGMNSEGATCSNLHAGCSTFVNHRKQTPAERGES